MKVTVEIEPDEVFVALKRGEGYDDVHPEILVDDARIQWPHGYRIVEPEEGWYEPGMDK